MTTLEFDNDDGSSAEYFLVAETGSTDSNGNGMFVDSFYDYRAYHQHYSQARRYSSARDAERARDEAESRYGKACVVVSVTH